MSFPPAAAISCQYVELSGGASFIPSGILAGSVFWSSFTLTPRGCESMDRMPMLSPEGIISQDSFSILQFLNSFYFMFYDAPI